VPEAALDPEPEAALDPEPEAALDPDPEAALDPEPEAALDPEPEAALDPEPEAALASASLLSTFSGDEATARSPAFAWSSMNGGSLIDTASTARPLALSIEMNAVSAASSSLI
jgi:hypothetical protein